jgi:hypothetical protein
LRWEDGHQWQADTYRKEEVMAYLKILPGHLPRGTEENNSFIVKYSPLMVNPWNCA